VITLEAPRNCALQPTPWNAVAFPSPVARRGLILFRYTDDKNMARAKASMALFFIKAAYRFYVQTKQFEDTNSYPNEDFNADALGGIISACSFLECYINEIYVAAHDEDQYYLGNIPKETVDLIRKLWDRNIARTARFGILEKYGIFLDLVGAEPFEKGSSIKMPLFS
jgi:hypothetical protein